MRFLQVLPFVILGLGLIWALGTQVHSTPPAGEAVPPSTQPTTKIEKVVKTDAEWRKILTPDQYYILRQQGTERPFRNEFWNHHEPGTYACAGCGLELFTSDTKFDSGTGWPSYYSTVPGHVHTSKDSDGRRDALSCERCDGHLGHVFDDGPKPTGLRYCIDSGALKFVTKK